MLFKLTLKLVNENYSRVPEDQIYYKQFNSNSYLLPDIGCIYFKYHIKKYFKPKIRKKGLLVHVKRLEQYQNFDFLEQSVSRKIKFPKEFFKKLSNYNLVYSYHYHTLLYCKIVGIKIKSLQSQTFKHRSINFFRKKLLLNSENLYREVFNKILK